MNQNDTHTKKNRTIAAVIIMLVIGIAAGVWVYETWFSGTSDEKVYVSSVSVLTGNLENGMRNRYQGVVESNNTWTAQVDQNRQIKEYKVNVGDTVEVGTVLLEYDNSAIEESIANARTELQRLNDELASLNGELNELNMEMSEATDPLAAEEASLEIQQKQIDIRAKNNEIAAKQQEITNQEGTLQSTALASEMAGVVKSIGSDDGSGGITIVDVNTFQVKGRVNEQNLSSLYQDEKVIVFSRVSNDIHWKGRITKIDKDNATQSSDEYDEEDDEMTSSSNYPFYVSLKKTEGLAVGQHVYIEENVGQLKNSDASVIELDAYLIVDSDTEAPYVWADDGNGKLEKRSVTLGEYNENADRYRIESGIIMTDLIAQPEENLKEGMRTVNSDEEDEEETSEEDSDEDEEEEDEDFE